MRYSRKMVPANRTGMYLHSHLDSFYDILTFKVSDAKLSDRSVDWILKANQCLIVYFELFTSYCYWHSLFNTRDNQRPVGIWDILRIHRGLWWQHLRSVCAKITRFVSNDERCFPTMTSSVTYVLSPVAILSKLSKLLGEILQYCNIKFIKLEMLIVL